MITCKNCGAQKADEQASEQNHVFSQQMQTNSNFVVPLDKTERKNALFEAIKRNDANAVAAILNSGYKPNKRIGEVTPLGFAALFDSADTAQVLIQHGAAVKGWRSITAWPPNHNPLMLAAINNSLHVAKLLIESGADVNSANINGRTAMKIAQLHGHTQMMTLLQSHGAKLYSVRAVLQKIITIIGILSPKTALQASSRTTDVDDTFLRERY